MCGIAGIIKFNSERVDPGSVQMAADLLENRGPDTSGVWCEQNVGLGHRRLSIIDLTDAAHQPMVSGDNRYVIVFNGEIYNFLELRKDLEGVAGSWSSSSDTEVILAAYRKWGVECVNHLEGMFAFSIWDTQAKTLFAARDRMGEKPFYYHHSKRCFVFASRPKALFPMDQRLARQVNEKALSLYLDSGYVPAPLSIYNDIFKLPPAHYLVVSDGQIRVERYWDFRHIEPERSWENRNEDDLTDELDELLSNSVKKRMISDVPLGAFLSGGIDSSLVVALMSKFSSTPVKTFTIGFEEAEYDESGHAKAVADFLGTDHFCEYMKANELVELMPQFLKEYDEPFFDYSAFPVMAVSRLARRKVTVSLSGDGGDELFGGYHYYRIVEKLGPLFSLPLAVRKGMATLLGFIPRHDFKLLAGAVQQENIIRSFAFSRSLSKDFGSLFVQERCGQEGKLSDLFEKSAHNFPEGLTPGETGMRLDALNTLPDDYLQKVDVASMAFSLETRIPMLDHHIVEWAMKLPVKWKLKQQDNKYLLRKLAYRYIPRRILDRPKMGFGVPVSQWLRKELKSWAEEKIYNDTVFKQIPLDQSRVQSLWQLHSSEKRDVHPLLWAVLIFIEFYTREIFN